MNFESINNKLKKIKATIPKVIDARKEVVEKKSQKIVGSSLLIAVSAIPKQLKVDENKAKPIMQKVVAVIPGVVTSIEKTIDKRKDVVKEKKNQKKETVDKKTKEVKNDENDKKERILDKVKEEWKNASTVVKRGTVTTGAVAAPGVITAREEWADFTDRLLGRGKYTKADARKIGERGKVNIKPKVESEIIGKIGEKKGTSKPEVLVVIAAGINPKYVDKVLRIEINSDVVASHVQSPSGYGPMGAGKPEIRKVDINIKDQAFGGHSAYFNKKLMNTRGVDNVSTTVDAMWDKIK